MLYTSTPWMEIKYNLPKPPIYILCCPPATSFGSVNSNITSTYLDSSKCNCFWLAKYQFSGLCSWTYCRHEWDRKQCQTRPSSCGQNSPANHRTVKFQFLIIKLNLRDGSLSRKAWKVKVTFMQYWPITIIVKQRLQLPSARFLEGRRKLNFTLWQPSQKPPCTVVKSGASQSKMTTLIFFNKAQAKYP